MNEVTIKRNVIVSDRFLMLSNDAQLVYFHALANADQSGHVYNLRSIIRLLELEDGEQLIFDLLALGFIKGDAEKDDFFMIEELRKKEN